MERPNLHSRISGNPILMNIIKKFRLAWYITDNYLAHKCLPNSIILQTWTEIAAINVNISVGAASHSLGILLSIFLTKEISTRGVDKSLSRPGRKQDTARKLTFASHSKKLESCPFNRVSAAAMTSASDEKWRTFNRFFFQSGRTKDLSAPLYYYYYYYYHYHYL